MEQNVNGANVHKISWSNNIMTLYFNSGQVVNYKDVPEGIAVGAAQAPSVGSYLRLYVTGKYSYEVVKNSEMKEENIALMHHKDTTVGLWATDRPEMIPEDIKHIFFEIKYSDIF